MVITHMAKGLSFESFSGKIGVNQDTLHEWCKWHKDFSEAKILAFERNRYFWENVGIEGLWVTNEKKLNSAVWIFNMKNRFFWRDRIEEISGETLSTVRIELPDSGEEQVIRLGPDDVKELKPATIKKKKKKKVVKKKKK